MTIAGLALRRPTDRCLTASGAATKYFRESEHLNGSRFTDGKTAERMRPDHWPEYGGEPWATGSQRVTYQHSPLSGPEPERQRHPLR